MSLYDLLPVQMLPTNAQLVARAINTAPERIPKRIDPPFASKSNRRYRNHGDVDRRDRRVSMSWYNEFDTAIMATTLKLLRVAFGRFASGNTPKAERILSSRLFQEYTNKQLIELFTEQMFSFIEDKWHESVKISIIDGHISLEILIRKEPRLKKIEGSYGYDSYYTAA